MELPQPQAGAKPTAQPAANNAGMSQLPNSGGTVSNLAAPPAHTVPAIAEDSDLIEKEWVIKAKHIVDQTKDNPRLQNQQITRLKADYMKRRYSKDLKVEQE